ncbi:MULTISPECIES: DUF805 domain-containing protein [Pseudomonas]|uniref:DUF805 domain-containing protein n=1 Tax=Pseudomonas asgharzadehiana TaxID=2842349 RepID=A0ABX8P5F8_9PSED|nr:MULTISPECIES: DUF805 domain-containing protein [Pseudomonas]MCX9151342.1 DUF805 domain-containing protein [Pseudomonas sp. TB1-B1]QXH69125.1 DUF805 domain-containing protein [Pseudomonas asgharzadehiana]TKJ58102.1 DUF805 domain-containing protein [Pseudomonas sp. CFBP13506]
MNWCFQAIKNYAKFSGRACRREYWAFAVMDAMVMLGSVVVANQAGIYSNPWFYVPFGIYVLFMIPPALSVTFRRLHDVNVTGAYVLWLLIPVVGFILVSIQLFTQGDRGVNDYGVPPNEL